MFFELLQYGEYTIGRPGKANYAKYTYTVNNGKIIFKVDQNSHDNKSAQRKLSKEILSLEINDAILKPDGEIHLSIDAFLCYVQKNSLRTELTVTFEAVQLLIDLTTDCFLEEVLEKIINKQHPLFVIYEDYEGNCCYKISPYIASGLATHIATIFQQRLCHYLNLQDKYKDQNISEVVIIVDSPQKQFESKKIINVSRQAQQDLHQLLKEKSADIEENRIRRDAALIIGNGKNNYNRVQPKTPYNKIYQTLTAIECDESAVGCKTLMTYFANQISQAPDNEKADYKNICLSLITQLFYKLTDLAQIADLFDHLLSLQTQIDIHKNPWTDSFFRIKNTESWQKLMGNVRNHAFTILEKQYDDTTLYRPIKTADTLLTDYRDRKIFAAHRANGLFSLGNTEAVNDIDKKLAPKPLTK